jgi:peptidyl-Asp metalloendopeptidase
MQVLIRTVRLSPRNTLTAVAMALGLMMVGAAPSGAQPAGGDAKNAGSAGEQVIISNTPQKHGALYTVLQRLLSKAKREKLAHTQSEVWTASHTEMDRLKQRLRSLGVKFTVLRDNWNHILRRDKAPLSRAQEEVLAKARQSPAMVGIGVMRAPEAAVAESALTGGPNDGTSRIMIPINDNQPITLVRSSAVRTDKGVIWRGTVEDTGESAVLQWWKDGHMNGLFSHKGHIYMVMNMGADLHAVLETDPKMMPPDHASSSDNSHKDNGRTESLTSPSLPKVEPITSAQLKELEAKKIVIDVMILYTKRVASHYIRSPEDVFEFAIEQVNEAFRNSGLGNVSLRLVHTQAVDYDEQGSEEFTDLYRMVDGDGPFKDVHRLRNEKHADIVGLIVDDPTGCGLSTRVAPDAEEAYFVVHYSCAAIMNSIAHEIGHLLGARHDRGTDPNDTPYPYGHGYVDGAKWRDIMSYSESCNGCVRIPFWSNPRVLYKGEPTGTLTEDNARVILEQAERVSKFR